LTELWALAQTLVSYGIFVYTLLHVFFSALKKKKKARTVAARRPARLKVVSADNYADDADDADDADKFAAPVEGTRFLVY